MIAAQFERSAKNKMKTNKIIALLTISLCVLSGCAKEPEKAKIVYLYDYLGMPMYPFSDVTVLVSKPGYIKIQTPYNGVIEFSGKYSIEH
jgi:hypothetical protein